MNVEPDAGVVDSDDVHALADYDPMSPAVQSDPFRFFRDAHAGCPVLYHRLQAGDVEKINANPLVSQPTTGFLTVFRHSDVQAIAQDHQLFSSAAGPGPERLLALNEVGMLVYADEPHHRIQRRIVSKALPTTRMKALRPRIEHICADLLDPIAPTGRADMIPAFASALPGIVFAQLLGVPVEDQARFTGWAEDLIAAFGAPPEVQARSFEAMTEISSYFLGLIDERRGILARGGSLPDDLLTAALVSDYEGRTFDDTEMLLLIHILLVAGHETTASGIGAMIHQLALHPDQLALVRDDRTLVENVVEEVLRHQSPIQGLFRTATTTTEIARRHVERDEKVRMCFAAANRDPEMFVNPDTFDITRDAGELRNHLAFGYGIHSCLGAPLGRLEMQIALTTLLDRLNHWWMDESTPSVRGDNLLARRFESLHIEWDPRPTTGKGVAS